MLEKLWSSVIVTALCGIPIWLYLIARWFLDPQDSLSEILLFGIGLYVLGTIQLVLFVVWIVLIISVWNYSTRRGIKRF